MKQGLIQQQTTKLIMTNELRQAISLLQFSSVELVDYLHEQANENPLLKIEPLPIERYRSKGKQRDTDSNDMPIAKEMPITLHDHLMEQISLLSLSEAEKRLMNYLILSIDESGYFVGNAKEISELFSVSISDIEYLLDMIQQCDPLGVGARNLQECLMIQLKALPERDELAEAIVSSDLERLADRKWKELSEKFKVAITDIQAVFDLIQTLNPRPGSIFYHEETKYIIPDMIIQKEDDGLKLYFNDQIIPTIKVDQTYEQYNQYKFDESYNKYIKEKLNEIYFIKRAYEQRLQTMRKVMEAIMELQAEFFLDGNGKLKPMTMKEIAQKIDVHESTVSRTVHGKYVQTPKGFFELKYFFTSTIHSANSEATSSKVVKETIAKMIQEENKQKPLSDQQIAKKLKEEYQYSVSRRTVAKYREQLGILSSSKRKRY